MKKWFQSKTIWVNVGLVLASVVTALVQGADWRHAVLAGIGVVGIILRGLTSTSLVP